MSTRFMEVLFSATESGDAELTNQVHEDIQKAKENGSFEDDEMAYEDLGEDGVLALDKANGECTLIHNNPIAVGDDVMIDLSEVPDYCIEDQSHPEVTEDGSFVFNPSEHEFSVTTDNTAVQKIFSDQDLVETVSESVYRSEQDAQVGDLKFEKDSDTDGVIVTDLSSGDKAKVELEGENMKVTELDQKNFKTYSNKSNMNVIRRKVFSHAEQYEPMFVVGIDSINKVLVNSPVYSEEQAQDLVERLMERGIEGVQVFSNPDEGRDYALALLDGCGAEEIADEEEMELAESEFSVIGNRYFSDRTRFMNRLFSEAEENVADHQELVESAIEDGDQLETEDFIITPVDESTAVVEDKANGEFTVAELDGEDINVEEISEEQANEMMEDLEVEADEEPEAPAEEMEEEEPAEEEENELEVEEVKEFSGKGLIGKFAGWIGKKGQTMKEGAEELAVKAVKKAEGAKKAQAHKLTNEANKARQAGVVEKLTKESDKLMNKSVRNEKIGNFLEKNADTIAKATAGTVATGAAIGTGAGVYKLTKKDKAASAVEAKEYSEDATLAQIEDNSIEAIQNVQEAAETAIQAIEQAKESPVADADDIKEVTYSDKCFSEVEGGSIYNPSLSELI